MMDYAFETVAADEGFFVGKTTGHREAILRRAAEGWPGALQRSREGGLAERYSYYI